MRYVAAVLGGFDDSLTVDLLLLRLPLVRNKRYVSNNIHAQGSFDPLLTQSTGTTGAEDAAASGRNA